MGVVYKAEDTRLDRFVELQRHKAVKASVLGLVHDAHASAAELFDDAVMRDNLANHSFPRAALKSYGRSSVKSNQLDLAVPTAKSIQGSRTVLSIKRVDPT